MPVERYEVHHSRPLAVVAASLVAVLLLVTGLLVAVVVLVAAVL